MQDHLLDLLTRDAHAQRPLEMQLQLGLAPERDQGGHRDHRAISERQPRPAPHVAEQVAHRDPGKVVLQRGGVDLPAHQLLEAGGAFGNAFVGRHGRPIAHLPPRPNRRAFMRPGRPADNHVGRYAPAMP
jgi:hypothetical protein